MRFPDALARLTASLELPFGYTLTIWTAGALAGHAFGGPDFGEVAAFAGGALLAYFSLALVAYRRLVGGVDIRARRNTLFNATPLAVIPIVAVLDRTIGSPLLGYFLSAACGTWTYVLLLAAATAWLTPRPQAPER